MVKYYGILNQTIKMCNLNIFAYILESMSRITFAFEVIFIAIVRCCRGIIAPGTVLLIEKYLGAMK